VRRFLPLATYYTGVTAFVDEYSVREHGTVNHALCAAIRELLRVRRALSFSFLSLALLSLAPLFPRPVLPRLAHHARAPPEPG